MNGAVGNEVLVSHGFIVTVVETGSVVTAVEELEGVVIEEIGRCGGKAKVNGVEVIEDGLVAAVNGAMAFVGNDEVIVAGRKPLIERHHAGVSREVDLCVFVNSAAFDP